LVVTTVAVNPDSTVLQIDENLELKLSVRAQDGSELTDRDVRWSSSNEDVVRVGQINGWIRGLRMGTATISATVDGVTGSTRIRVFDRHDDYQWHAIQSEFGSMVHCMTMYAGDLYACGSSPQGFAGATSRFVAKWDSGRWLNVSPEIGEQTAMTPFNGELVIGGNFRMLGTDTVNGVASWNGSRWAALKHGIPGSLRIVTAMVEHQGDLIIGGTFDPHPPARHYLLRWDGSEWYTMGEGLNGRVQSLISHGGSLYIGGGFSTVAGQAVNGIARWDGAEWHALGEGVNDEVLALNFHNGELYAGGQFSRAGGIAANNIARWDGQEWHALGQWNLTESGINWLNAVQVIVSFRGTLIAGGRTYGLDQTYAIASWDGEIWHGLRHKPLMAPTHSQITSLQEYNGTLIAGGLFNEIGSVKANHVARWAPRGYAGP
jgi:trimeric autotransporter adhesin